MSLRERFGAMFGAGHEAEQTMEQEQDFHSEITLDIFRHGDKQPGAMSELERPLSEKGRSQAMTRGAELRDDDAPAVAFGSPMPRSQETAARIMANKDLTDQDMQMVFDQLNGQLKVGKKIGVDEKLSFKFEGEMRDILVEKLKNGGYLPWLVEESDKWVTEHNDQENSSYSRFAANIAEIIKKYTTVAPRFDKIVSDNPDKYGSVMQRFLGSHQGVGECFLSKVIAKVGGQAEQEKFLAAVGNGFGDAEGFHVDVNTPSAGADPEVYISYQKKDAEGKMIYEFKDKVPMQVIDEIIAERV